jgi:hypothetical protein
MRAISLAMIALATLGAYGQDSQPPAVAAPSRIIGEVTAVDASANRITVKTDAGANATALLDEKTLYLKVPPGEKDLKKATRISLSEIVTGDRVYARGKLSEDGQSIAAVSVIVMTKSDLARKQEQDRAEWTKRGTAGTVTAVKPEAKAFEISTRTREGARTVTVDTAAGTNFRRYAADSVRFADAKPSSFDELRSGDHVRILGDRSETGDRIQAQEVVSGAFRNLAAIITGIKPDAGEIQVKDLQNKKAFTVRVNGESMLRRMPEMMAARMATRLQGGGAPGGRGDAPGVATRRPSEAAGAPGTAGVRAPGAGGFGGNGGGVPDFMQMLERLPAMSLAELKQGDAVIVSSTEGADPSKLTAIVLVAGVEPLLTSPQAERQLGGAWSFDIPLP